MVESMSYEAYSVLLFVAGILVTAAMYLFVPCIFCAIGWKLTNSQIRRIVITNGICVFLIDAGLALALFAEDPQIIAAIIWSLIAYGIMKTKLLKTEPKLPQNHKYCSVCGNVMPLNSNQCNNCGAIDDPLNGNTYNNDRVYICVSKEGETPTKYGRFRSEDIRFDPSYADKKQSQPTHTYDTLPWGNDKE